MKSATLASTSPIGPRTAGEWSAPHALAALAALGQPTRLEIFRLLVSHEPKGLAAGAIAEEIGCPQNTVSSHLAILSRASLTYGTRVGRSIIYRANVASMRALVEFLVSDCCNGHPQLCDLADAKCDSGCGPGAKTKSRPRGKIVRRGPL